jgi:hypothetical protein
MEMLLDMVNQNIQEAHRKFQDTKKKYERRQKIIIIKKYEKTQKQINELIGALNKHQSETL